MNSLVLMSAALVMGQVSDDVRDRFPEANPWYVQAAKSKNSPSRPLPIGSIESAQIPVLNEVNNPVAGIQQFTGPITSGEEGVSKPKKQTNRLPFVWIKPQAPAATETAQSSPKHPLLRDRVFPDGWLEEIYDLRQRRLQFYHVPFTLGAWHWYHVNNAGPLNTGYGIPNLQGTYYWYVLADPVLFKNETGGFVKSAGAHVDFRIRENDQFRSFFPTSSWLWEAYGYVDTGIGKFKAGQIWKRFGMDWDGSFWGNAPYFDGFKLDPDWGLSWEHTWKCNDKISMDSFAQFFFHEDGVNGSIEGAGPDSLPGSHERNFGLLRLVPTWKHKDHTVTLGFSGMIGKIDNDATVLGGQNELNTAWAVDATYQYKNFKVYAEYIQSHGVRSPAHYVSGGPSDRIDNFLVGTHYKLGPATLRFTYSAGWYDNPDGFQELFVPGVTVALTKNVDLYCEYVRWNARNQNSVFSEFEEGVQLVINWRY